MTRIMIALKKSWKRNVATLSLGFFILSFTCQCNEKVPTEKFEVETPLSYLALGDSYTIGESVAEEDRWPNQMVKAINQINERVTPPKIIAQTGWRTDNMLDAAQAEISADTFDLVSLLIGVNNEFQGRSVESFESDFKDCLDYAIAHCHNGTQGVFVLSIPDYGYTPYGEDNIAEISPRIDAYNAICEAECELQDVAYYDITTISRSGLDDLTLVADDGLHPSRVQYEAWVDSCVEQVKELLNNFD